MAKGRKLGTSSRQERLLETFGYGGGGHGNGNGTDVSELVEEDVWSMVDDMENMDLSDHRDDRNNTRHPSPPMSTTANGWSSHGSRNRRWTGSGGREERAARGGLSMAFVDDSGSGRAQSSRRIVHQSRGGGSQDGVASQCGNGHHMATSAPVNVPDWPKILRVNSVELMHDSDNGFDDGDSERVPPHEYLAREYQRTRKMTATSVLEGVGRTLKGRDLSRVRDAVWSQTGFAG
ncbi:uncharacterized protein LOC122641597 [Telopea speciosissima]|uniref:uncharacterized protein LOC122641597 n=1 Tax=Telopea speciosissima TaxID=54955 RepID=UPI001CC620BC|nr:uncharacterized protein LOC122641597 [Telopea speciosissima]